MPYWCSDCRSYFSVRTGTALERSRVPLRKWAFSIYLELTSLKSVSSMKLHRDIGVTQSTAWFMLHRIREAWTHAPQTSGPSHHNLRIDGLEFTARIVDLHLPVDTALRAIDVGGPRRDFAVQGPEVADAAPA